MGRESYPLSATLSTISWLPVKSQERDPRNLCCPLKFSDQLLLSDYVVIPGAADILAVLVQSDSIWSGYDPSIGVTENGSKLFPDAVVGRGQPDQERVDGWVATFPSESMFLDMALDRKGNDDRNRPQQDPKSDRRPSASQEPNF